MLPGSRLTGEVWAVEVKVGTCGSPNHDDDDVVDVDDDDDDAHNYDDDIDDLNYDDIFD